MPVRSKKIKEITDDMIGNADPVCTCAKTVGDMIIYMNKAKQKKLSIKKTLNSLRKDANTPIEKA
ncbi:MAG: hypothetical protein Q8K51_14375 [Nitrospirota bacterium]|nr:hypothetical protein [Nitrospirota bacterium]